MGPSTLGWRPRLVAVAAVLFAPLLFAALVITFIRGWRWRVRVGRTRVKLVAIEDGLIVCDTDRGSRRVPLDRVVKADLVLVDPVGEFQPDYEVDALYTLRELDGTTFHLALSLGQDDSLRAALRARGLLGSAPRQVKAARFGLFGMIVLVLALAWVAIALAAWWIVR